MASMELWRALPILIVAACLEAGGDWLMRTGLHSDSPSGRLARCAFAVAVLGFYGFCVNSTKWDFGDSIGVYVIFFFVIAQVIAWCDSGKAPAGYMWAGGALIVAGGIVIAIAQARIIPK